MRNRVAARPTSDDDNLAPAGKRDEKRGMFRGSIAWLGGALASLAPAVGAPPPFGRPFTIAAPPIRMLWVEPGRLYQASVHGSGDDTQVTITRGY